ncbi:MAG: O-acetyl-ADP-ribose deacetylase [Bacteroidia bacterium]|nr:O-acetyl-ADP-ribose deacetylase [Bacteroidia bacterium]
MKIECIKADITTIVVDAIVNAANTSLIGGGGVDGAIHRKGGKAILDDCIKIRQRQGGCKPGEAVITTAGNLPAQFVIHTVGPVWQGGKKAESDKLGNCYINSLQLAEEHALKSLAFPNISTGIYRYPKEAAAKVAIESVSNYQTESLEKVIFVCFDQENFDIYHNLLK